MSKFVVGLVVVACAVTLSAFGQNKVVFDNQSGDPARVKLIGPTKTEVQVPVGTKQGVDALAGKYTIKVRYGTPGSFRYSKGQEFEVTETATARSETTITLHKVVGGNYDAHPISESEFGTTTETQTQAQNRQTPTPAGSTTNNTVGRTNAEEPTGLFVSGAMTGPPPSIWTSSDRYDLLIVCATVDKGRYGANDFTVTPSSGDKPAELLGLIFDKASLIMSAGYSTSYQSVGSGTIFAMVPGRMNFLFLVPKPYKGPIKFKGPGTESNIRLLEDTTEWCVDALASEEERVRAIAAEILKGDKRDNLLHAVSTHQDQTAIVLPALRKAEASETNVKIKADMEAAIRKFTQQK